MPVHNLSQIKVSKICLLSKISILILHLHLGVFVAASNEHTLDHTWSTTDKASSRVCSLLAATEKLGDYNTSFVTEYNGNRNPKAQSAQM